ICTAHPAHVAASHATRRRGQRLVRGVHQSTNERSSKTADFAPVAVLRCCKSRLFFATPQQQIHVPPDSRCLPRPSLSAHAPLAAHPILPFVFCIFHFKILVLQSSDHASCSPRLPDFTGPPSPTCWFARFANEGSSAQLANSQLLIAGSPGSPRFFT